MTKKVKKKMRQKRMGLTQIGVSKSVIFIQHNLIFWSLVKRMKKIFTVLISWALRTKVGLNCVPWRVSCSTSLFVSCFVLDKERRSQTRTTRCFVKRFFCCRRSTVFQEKNEKLPSYFCFVDLRILKLQLIRYNVCSYGESWPSG